VITISPKAVDVPQTDFIVQPIPFYPEFRSRLINANLFKLETSIDFDWRFFAFYFDGNVEETIQSQLATHTFMANY
jgi:hypothetical protein